MRKVFGLMGIVVIAIASGSARADGNGNGDCHGDHCRPKTKTECFNLVCYYSDSDAKVVDGEFKSCKAVATFFKDVTEQGGEVTDEDMIRISDDSDKDKNISKLAVSCDEKPALFNNSAYRFTDLLGTLIQGQEGPNPAVRLPRGELHTNLDGNGEHVSPSELQLAAGTLGDREQRLKGSCFIWTGKP